MMTTTALMSTTTSIQVIMMSDNDDDSDDDDDDDDDNDALFSDCPDGYHGINCELECGHCFENAPCDVITGVCPEVCEEGWGGAHCKNFTGTGSNVTPSECSVCRFCHVKLWCM